MRALLVLGSLASITAWSVGSIAQDVPAPQPHVVYAEAPVENEIGLSDLARVLTAMYPEYGGLVGVGMFLLYQFRQRPKHHYKDAIKKLFPSDGIIDLKGGLKSLDKALGGIHSTEDPEVLRQIADKLEAGKRYQDEIARLKAERKSSDG